jgi:hypothetical protein
LAILAGPHLLEHLVGTGGDRDHCAVCAWTHTVRGGAPAAAPVIVPTLPLDDSLAPPAPLVLPLVAIASQVSRAPPTIA